MSQRRRDVSPDNADAALHLHTLLRQVLLTGKLVNREQPGRYGHCQ